MDLLAVIKEVEAMASLSLSPTQIHKQEMIQNKGLPDAHGACCKWVYGVEMSNRPLAINDGEVLEAIKSGDFEKAKAAVTRKLEDYRPTDEQLSKINKLSNTDAIKEDFYVWRSLACDSMKDRHSDILLKQFHASAARMAPDKSMLLDHMRSSGAVIGKIFNAETNGKELYLDFWTDAQNEVLTRALALGRLNKVSISFSTKLADIVCSSCKKSLYDKECPHYPGWPDEKGFTVYALVKDCADFFELSIVAIPAQPRAGIRRSAVPEETMPELSLSLSESGSVITVNDVLTKILGWEPIEEKLGDLIVAGKSFEDSVNTMAKVLSHAEVIEKTNKLLDEEESNNLDTISNVKSEGNDMSTNDKTANELALEAAQAETKAKADAELAALKSELEALKAEKAEAEAAKAKATEDASKNDVLTAIQALSTQVAGLKSELDEAKAGLAATAEDNKDADDSEGDDSVVVSDSATVLNSMSRSGGMCNSIMKALG